MQTIPIQTAKLRMPPLHAKQQEIRLHPSRFKVLACGRRWGKTRLGVALALEKASQRGRVWWVAPTYSQSGIAWRLAKPMALKIPGVIPREADRALLLSNGGEIWFKSSDREDNLRGEGINFLVMDEADYQDEDVWQQVLRPALADRKGSAMFISTPNVENGWFHNLFKKGEAHESDWASWQLPSWTNPFLDPKEIDAARETMPSIVFRREFGAEFVSGAGARIRREWLRVDEPPAGLSLAMGVDLAISTKTGADYTAAAVIGRAPLGHRNEGDLWILDVARTQQPFHGVLRFIEDMAAKWKPRSIAIEEVQYQAAVVQDLLRRTKLPVRGVRPDKDKLTRFQPLEARYEQGLVHHAPNLPRDFEDELLGFPVASHDDQVDALSYAWTALAEGAAGETLSRAMANAFRS